MLNYIRQEKMWNDLVLYKSVEGEVLLRRFQVLVNEILGIDTVITSFYLSKDTDDVIISTLTTEKHQTIPLSEIFHLDSLVPYYYDRVNHDEESLFIRLCNVWLGIEQKYYKSPPLFANKKNIEMLKRILSCGSTLGKEFCDMFWLQSYLKLLLNKGYSVDYSVTNINDKNLICKCEGFDVVIKKNILFEFARERELLDSKFKLE